jgi:glucose uptake protein
MVAALWGILVWREFAGASRKVVMYLVLMFIFYMSAIAIIANAY